MKISVFLILLTTAHVGFANEANNTKNVVCWRCHGMETLAYRDKLTGEIVNLYVNPQQYQQSNHRHLECTTCHTADFSIYPHPDSVKSENLYCLDCHQDEPKFIPSRFPFLSEKRAPRNQFSEIERAFKNSVHATQEQFSCFSCHDPHQFKISRVGEEMTEIVRHGNEICLNCHASPITPSATELSLSHQWLPNLLLHWRSVRCVECHTPATSHFSHQVLSAAQSAKNCVQCHSKEATLLTRLYKYRSQEEGQSWFNKAVFNKAYIIGMSRNETIDRWSLIILLLTIAGLLAHGFGRFIATRRKNK